jgi:cytoskeletal protein RodZ
MSRPDERLTPEGRDRAQVRLRRLTRTAVLAATGATALIGVVVAKEHPGASGTPVTTDTTPSSSTSTSTSTSTTTAPSTGSGSVATPTTVAPTTTTRAPTTTTTTPKVTSGGSSR